MVSVLSATTTTPEENKKILHRWCGEVFNAKKVDMIDQLKVPNYADWSRFPGQAPTLESFKGTLRMFFTAFPDFEFRVDDTIASGDMGLIRGHWRGTHTGSFLGLPATGKSVGGERIDFFRFSEGKMSEHWGTGLELHVLELMGFSPKVETPDLSRGSKGIVRPFFDSILQQRNPMAVDSLFAGDAAGGFRQSLDMLLLHSAFPDGQVTVEHVMAEKDKVAVHSTLSGTHLGTYLGVPPTGKKVSVTKIDILRLDGGKIVESWHQWENVSLLIQLGVVNPPPVGAQVKNN
jgi:predicted ester cyclase